MNKMMDVILQAKVAVINIFLRTRQITYLC